MMSVLGDAPDLYERFMDKVEKQPGKNPCWKWTGCDVGGIGRLRISNGKSRSTRRLSHELHIGPVPPGLVVAVSCRNVWCVAPRHLLPVTRREAVLRSPRTIPAQNISKTHCPKGHRYTPENTRIVASSRTRVCRKCSKARNADWQRNAWQKNRCGRKSVARRRAA